MIGYYERKNRMESKNLLTIPPADPRVTFFDHLAQTWDTQEQKPEAIIPRLEELRGLLDFRPGQDLLEVGCGTGQITQWLADSVQPGRVTAIDFSGQMLNKARSRGIDVEFRQVDVCSGNLGKGRFDVAMCFQSFPHFRDKAAALRNLAVALKPDGKVIVMHLAGSDQINAFHAGVEHTVTNDRLPTENQWDPLLRQAGLQRENFIDREGLFFLRCSRKGS